MSSHLMMPIYMLVVLPMHTATQGWLAESMGTKVLSVHHGIGGNFDAMLRIEVV